MTKIAKNVIKSGMKAKKPTVSKAQQKKALRRRKLVARGLAKARGPEPSVTLAVVDRVGKRMAKGLTLELALSLEAGEVAVETFQRAVQRDIKLFTHLARQKAKNILDFCEDIMATGEMADKKWLYARRHPELFGESVAVKHSGEVAVSTISPEERDLAKVIALARMNREMKQLGT